MVKARQYFLHCGNRRMGSGNQRVSAGEGEGGQTHWLAEEERIGKRDGEENTRKSDSWPCPTLLLFMSWRGSISASALLHKLSLSRPSTGMFFTALVINLI